MFIRKLIFPVNFRERRKAKMKTVQDKVLAGERASFMAHNTHFENCRFEKGESPLKETRKLEITGCTFGWKYPLWYGSRISVDHTHWEFMARAGVWYTNDLTVSDCVVDAPKNFRRCKRIRLENVQIPNAQETLWWNKHVTLRHIQAKGDYFCMNSDHVKVSDLTLDGNYPFDGCKDVEVRDSVLMSKDAFWNCRNVTIYNSVIEGEYLAWNSDHVTLVGCTIKSLQGLCYVRHLTLKNCRLEGTSLAFEYSDVNAEIIDSIDSVINPSSGIIRAPRIGELIMEPKKIDPSQTTFRVPQVDHRYDHNIYEGVILNVEQS